MKYIIAVVLFLSLVAQIMALADFANKAEAPNSKELDWMLQGGNDNLFLVNFYMPGDNHGDVKTQLQTKIATNSKYNNLVTYVEVNAARTYQYKEVLEEIGIYDKPARMYPFVLLVKKGEGYLFRGDKIGQQVSEKIAHVVGGRVDYSSTRE